ncbi:ammonium transporter [Rubellicoccus peritrichatus]|uniref:Ammonium transporter n=1 Tax=Rubellicoccus peritrichatus TaxID=3080537 RepID=A0AAQ3QX82_9BACT|nr:ammonium transporter [Puniceicoccus sp. CR14]WOO42615.1 ammonium transporter [Puniceicoccus sp. CR14]
MNKKISLLKLLAFFAGLTLFAGFFSSGAMAQEEIVDAVVEATSAAEPDEDYLALVEKYGATFDFFTISNLWTLIAAALVFLMHLGFATLESGLAQSKNTVNVLFKNVFIICMGIITYLVWGFNAMYPGDFNGFFAMGTPLTMADYGGTDFSYGGTGLCMTGWSDFIFQAMFAATAATIVSGAVAERIKLHSFMIFATLLVMFAYPVTGSWKWGGGWLDQMGFYDFAGSSLVHAFGGFAALACVLLLGARKGKYLAGGKIKPILGHSMPLATIGVFLLFLGWFGFNGGSVLSADPELVSFVFVTTAVAAAAGGLASILVSWIVIKKPDLSMALNGILAGLVGITAGADSVTLIGSVLIGLISGAIVVFSILIFDKIKIDDPVGAISVHGICGIWGTLAVAIFQQEGAGFSFVTQLIGTLSISAFAFIFSLIFFGIIKVTIGVRVSEEEEYEGLDIGEHGQEAYPDFQGSTKG